MSDQDPYPDEIFKRGALTTMEKLLFANKHIEDLKKELSQAQVKTGELISEKGELEDKNRKLETEIKNLKHQNTTLQKANQDHLNGIKKEKYIQDMKKDNADLFKRFSAARDSNRELVHELSLLKNVKK